MGDAGIGCNFNARNLISASIILKLHGTCLKNSQLPMRPEDICIIPLKNNKRGICLGHE
jgi:hypothetical protein